MSSGDEKQRRLGRGLSALLPQKPATVTVVDEHTVKIATELPMQGSELAASQPIINGVKLAIKQHGAETGCTIDFPDSAQYDDALNGAHDPQTGRPTAHIQSRRGWGKEQQRAIEGNDGADDRIGQPSLARSHVVQGAMWLDVPQRPSLGARHPGN